MVGNIIITACLGNHKDPDLALLGFSYSVHLYKEFRIETRLKLETIGQLTKDIGQMKEDRGQMTEAR